MHDEQKTTKNHENLKLITQKHKLPKKPTIQTNTLSGKIVGKTTQYLIIPTETCTKPILNSSNNAQETLIQNQFNAWLPS